jgi:hypothetical protein
MRAYRAQFEPSAQLARPHAIIALAAVVAETDEEAERLAATYELNWLRRARGEVAPLPSPEEALAYPWSESERAYVRAKRARLFVGAPERAAAQIADFAQRTQADEVMVTSAIYDPEARARSFDLLMQAWRAQAAAPQAAE